MPSEENNLWNVLQGLGLTGNVRTPQLDSDAIARAQGDDQILGLLKLLDADLSENSLPSECDPLMERLTFTSRSLSPESRRREWSEFLNLDFDRLKRSMKRPLLIDGRNMYSYEEMKQRGWTYISMGRPSVNLSGKNR